MIERVEYILWCYIPPKKGVKKCEISVKKREMTVNIIRGVILRG
jgi:hypothetical protein